MNNNHMSSESRQKRLLIMKKLAKPYLAVVLLQFGYAALAIIAKSALNQGMSTFTFSVYRNVIAFALFAPFALLFERKVRPRMTISIFFKIMLLGLLEPVIDQNLYYSGMKYTSATFSSAMSNVLPAITFFMAWMFRLEKVNIKTLHGQGKIMGTLVTVGGAMIMTLIKGPTIGLPWTSHHQHHIQSKSATDTRQQDQIKGSLMITAGCFCWASFFILQAITLKSYPAELSLTSLICMMGAVQGTLLTLIVEKGNTSIWSIHWDTKLLAAVYSGIICSGFGYYVSGVIMRTRGPVFVTAFNPLSMVIVAIVGSSFLAEQMDLGRVVGAIVIIVGLYLVIWGKSKDETASDSDISDKEVLPVDHHHQMTIQTNDSSKHDRDDDVSTSTKIAMDQEAV